MNWLMKRIGEPSTWAGLAMAAVGVGEVAKIKEAQDVAEALGAAGEAAAASGGDPVLTGVALVGGLLSILMKEKGGR